MLNRREPVPLGKRIGLIVGLAAFFALVVLFVVSFAVDGKWETEHSVTIELSPEQIYPLVNSVSRWERWTNWNKSDLPDLEREFKGPTEGVGSAVIWDRGPVSGVTRIFRVVPNKQVSFNISTDQRQGYAEGRIVLRQPPGGGDTEVFIRMWGDAGTDPWEKLAMKLYYRDRLDHDLQLSLNRLRDKLENYYNNQAAGQ